jgi:opacity protein-like surface antigen
MLLTANTSLCREIKVRGSAFIPTSKLFREIYGTANGSVDIEFAADICSYLQGWANYDWMGKKGHTKDFCSPTKIDISSISFGLKTPYDINSWLTLYAGFGPSFALVKIKNESPFCGTECSTNTSIGVVIKTGADFFFTKSAFVDLFIDYAYQNVNFETSANVSNVRIGGGLGVTF